MNAQLAASEWTAIGVGVRLVVTDAGALEDAERIVREEVRALDLAASRFRDDSELAALNSADGARVGLSPLLAQAIGVALDAARDTGGDVDPTLGAELADLGYDRDFAALPANAPAVRVTTARTASWRRVELDRDGAAVRLPRGVQFDLGATAKALGADRAAARANAELGCGVLVGLGGDLAMAGAAPDGGWPVRVQDRPGPLSAVPDGPSVTVALGGGGCGGACGLATSSTTARRWMRGGQWLHHVLDPRTGMPARSPWRTVTVAANSCVAANVATTAAIVRGEGAVRWLGQLGLPARLVSQTGEVSVLGGWPSEGASEGASAGG